MDIVETNSRPGTSIWFQSSDQAEFQLQWKIWDTF